MYLMGIVYRIVQFFRRFCAGHEQFRRFGQSTGGNRLPHLLHYGIGLRGLHVLRIWFIRHIISYIQIPFIPDGALRIVPLVHPVADTEYVFTLFRQPAAEERPPLHITGNLHSKEVQDRRPEIYRTYHPVLLRSGPSLPFTSVLFRYPDNQQNMRPRIIQPPFRAGAAPRRGRTRKKLSSLR